MAELKRVLGFWTVLALSIGSIMGTGLFFGASVGTSYSGNAIILVWIALSLVAVYISMYFSELAALYPKAGGVYEFSKHAYSRFFSFLMGWLAWIVGNLTTSLVVVAATDYLIPDNSNAWLKILISVFFIIALNIIALIGIEASAFVLMIFAAISFGVLLSVIFPGTFALDMANYSPFFAFGISSLFITFFFLSESFFGWESATYLAEETKDPEKVIPKAIIIGTIIVGVLGILATAISLGVIPWKILSVSDAPLSLVAEKLLGGIGSKILDIGIFAALVGSAAGGVVTMPRLILALARDKLFIHQFSQIHEKFRTPYKAIIFQTIVSLLIFAMAFGKYEPLLSLLLPLGFFMYFFVILSVPILRKKEKNAARPFKVPFANAGSLLLIFLLLGIMVLWSVLDPSAVSTIKLAASLLLIGIPIYFLLEIYYNPDTVIKINDMLAYMTLFFENIILPKKVRREIINLLGDINGRRILEFGCSVGTLTLDLAEKVKPAGFLYATDLSKHEVVIAKNRMVKKGHYHVVVVHDEHQVNRVHPSIPHVDAIVSIGMMGYMQDVKKILKEMRSLMPYNGKIVFVDYVDFFKFFPNVDWLSDDKTIERLFRESGFSVFVKRKKGIFWNYVYVYGIKFQENIPYA